MATIVARAFNLRGQPVSQHHPNEKKQKSQLVLLWWMGEARGGRKRRRISSQILDTLVLTNKSCDGHEDGAAYCIAVFSLFSCTSWTTNYQDAVWGRSAHGRPQEKTTHVWNRSCGKKPLKIGFNHPFFSLRGAKKKKKKKRRSSSVRACACVRYIRWTRRLHQTEDARRFIIEQKYGGLDDPSKRDSNQTCSPSRRDNVEHLALIFYLFLFLKQHPHDIDIMWLSPAEGN